MKKIRYESFAQMLNIARKQKKLRQSISKARSIIRSINASLREQREWKKTQRQVRPFVLLLNTVAHTHTFRLGQTVY